MTPKYLLSILLFCVIFSAFLVSGEIGADVDTKLTGAEFKCMKEKGVGFFTIRCWLSTGAPDPYCASSILAAVAEKLPAQALFQPCFSKSPITQMEELAAYYTEKKLAPPITWLDMSDPPKGNCIENIEFLHNLTASASKNGVYIGIHTSQTVWTLEMCNTSGFDHLPLRFAEFDGKATFTGFKEFGGWKTPNVKQYSDKAEVCNVKLSADYRPGVGPTTSSATHSATHTAASVGPAAQHQTSQGSSQQQQQQQRSTSSAGSTSSGGASSGGFSSGEFGRWSSSGGYSSSGGSSSGASSYFDEDEYFPYGKTENVVGKTKKKLM